MHLRRNFRGMPFTPLMTKENKLQVEKKVVDVVGELYGQYFPIHTISQADKDWLAAKGVSLDKDPVHTAAGMNDDYPHGRGVFKEDTGSFVVLVNMEDHL